MDRALPALLALVLSSGSPSPDDGEPMTRALLSYADPAYLEVLREQAGPNGWGLTFAWDAFEDGTVNPDSTAYAITTALVLQAFLDADQEPPPGIAERWTDYFSDGFYWYSDQPSDAIFTPNVSAMMASVMYRLGYTEQADDAIRRLVETAQDGPTWRYSDAHDSDNDALHHLYTVWGIESYRARGGSVPIHWTAAEALAATPPNVGYWPTAASAMRAEFARCFTAGPVPDVQHGVGRFAQRDAAHAVFVGC